MLNMAPFNPSRRRGLCQAVALLTAALTSSGQAWANKASVTPVNPWPKGASYTIGGRFKGFGYKAQGQLDWHMDADRYELRLLYKMPLVGQRTQVSQGVLTTAGLQPQRYEELERRNGLWILDANQALQDKLSVLLQLAWLQQSGLAQPHPGQTVRLQVGKRADTWLFECLGPQTVSTELGSMATVSWLRKAPTEDDTQVQVWYAPSQGHWPVRMRLQQGTADVVDQTLQAWL